MKIVAHEFNSKKYKGFLNALGVVNSVDVWDSQYKSIYDMDLEKEPDIILIPSNIKSFQYLETSSEAVAQRTYLINLDDMPICANKFPKGEYKKLYESDILILPDSLSSIYSFSSLLYPNQNQFRVKVISSVPFPIAEYIGYDNVQTIANYIASTKLVVCTDKQTEINMWGIPNLHSVNIVEDKLFNLKSFFEYYSNFNKDSVYHINKIKNYEKVKNGLTYYHECINFYKILKKEWYKAFPFDEMIELTKEKI